MDGAANEQGLEAFLDVAPQEQWLLLVDLDGNLLPYDQIRIRDTELRDSPLPGKRLLVVENERCCHLLPRVEECLALLGAGLNLAWLEANWLGDRQIAYWRHRHVGINNARKSARKATRPDTFTDVPSNIR